jgi:hypothetical protein
MVNGLNAQEDAIVQDVVRYRLSTSELIALRGTGGVQSIEEGMARLDLLAQEGWLRRGVFVPGGNEPYYFPGPRLAEAYGLNEQATRELSFEHRLARFAIARFCAEPGQLRELMTDEEFGSRFPMLFQPGQPRKYYLERVGDQTRLAFIKVDLGGSSQWDRAVDACNRFLSKRSELSPRDPRRSGHTALIRQMIECGRFQVSLLLASPDKARAVAARLDAAELARGVRPAIVPYVVPGLLPLAFQLAANRGSVSRGSRVPLNRRANASE